MKQQPNSLVERSVLPLYPGVKRVKDQGYSQVDSGIFYVAPNKQVDNKYQENRIAITVNADGLPCLIFGDFLHDQFCFPY